MWRANDRIDATLGQHKEISARISVKYIRLSAGSLIEALAKLALALTYSVFLYIFLADFWEHGRLSGLLFAIVES